jgi:geranylgeranyl pyrophosphate synthase
MDLKDFIIFILLCAVLYYNMKWIKQGILNTVSYFFPLKIDNYKMETDLSLVEKEQEVIQKYIDQYIDTNFKDSKLVEILLHITKGGKKVRPVIVTSIYKQLSGSNEDTNEFIYEVASSIEYLHCASLVIDDIMDGDEERRGKIATHIQYGINNSQIASIILSSLAIKKIFDCFQKLSQKEDNNKNLPFIVGQYIANMIQNIALGQYMDINQSMNIDELITNKTSSLFEYCFVMPWLVFNYNKDDDTINKGIHKMRKIGKKFGLIFQIADDFEDVKQDLLKCQTVNYVISNGVETSSHNFNRYIEKFNELAKKHNVLTPEIEQIIVYLTEKVNKIL